MDTISSKYQKTGMYSLFLLFIKALLRNGIGNYFAKICLLLLLFVISSQSFSQIIVGGTMTNSQTWTNDNVYLVVQDLIVPEGIVLTIEQGVEVRVNYGRGITVNNGSLKVHGVVGEVVRFIPNHVNAGDEWKWKGITIENANLNHECYFNFAEVAMAEIAIQLQNCENVLIENSKIIDCQNLGIQIVNSSFCSIANCKIEGNYDGIEILTSALGLTANNAVENCIIRNQNHNIYIFREEGATYRNNVISENVIDSGNNGIWINYIGDPIYSENIIERNFIINNGANVGYGLLLAHDSTIVANNIFWNNNIALFCEQKADNSVIINNSYYKNDWTIAIGEGSENSKYLNNTFSLNLTTVLGISESNNQIAQNNILNSCDLEKIVFNNTDVDFSISDNYWGTVDTAVINNMIYDKYDNPVLGKLYYSPYLLTRDTSNPVAPPYKVIKQLVGGKVRVSWLSNCESDLKGYNIYYGMYSNYSFSDSYNSGVDTAFVFYNDVSIFDTIAVTAYDSVETIVNPQLTGNESPFAFATIFPYSGADTVFCQNPQGLDIFSSTIPMEYNSLFWETNGDGYFNNILLRNPTYFPGSADLIGNEVIISLFVITDADTLVDSFSMSVIHDPVANAGSDTIVIADSPILLADASAINFDNILWLTDGDGSFDNDTIVTPVYYPGSSDKQSGFVHLEMIAYSQCGYSADTIIINIMPYFSVEGKIRVSQKSVNTGVVVAFQQNSEGAKAIQIENAQLDGSFKFEKLMVGNYYLYALPDTNNIDFAVPGYYANKLNWQSAYLLPVFNNVYDVDIYLPQIDFLLPQGVASISGHMVKPQYSKYNSDIYCTPWFTNSNTDFCNGGLSNITVFLFNNTKTKLLDYTLTNNVGDFYFNSLPFGSYIVDAEKAGFFSADSQIISLSPEHKNESGVILSINQQKIDIHFERENDVIANCDIFPNPATQKINIPIANLLSSAVQINIYDIFGKQISKNDTPYIISTNSLIVDVEVLSPGIYFGHVVTSTGTKHFRFVKL